jgi:methionine biosynthesis protein MetW
MTSAHAYDFDLRLDDPVSTHAVQFRMIPEGSSVLDAGCHTGILGEALRERKHCIVTGIDNDKEALRAAATRLDAVLPIELEQPGWTQGVIGAGKKDFDIVLFGDVIEHTRNPLNILREASILLASGGQIVVSVPNVANLRVRLGLLRGRFDYTDSGILDKTHLRFFTLRSARKLIEQAGYKITREAYSGYSMPRWLIDRAPSLFAVNIIMMAKPKLGSY